MKHKLLILLLFLCASRVGAQNWPKDSFPRYYTAQTHDAKYLVQLYFYEDTLYERTSVQIMPTIHYSQGFSFSYLASSTNTGNEYRFEVNRATPGIAEIIRGQTGIIWVRDEDRLSFAGKINTVHFSYLGHTLPKGAW